MRSVTILCLILSILNFSFHGADCVIEFRLAGATAATYKAFIKTLRDQLSVNTQQAYNIPILKHQVAPDQRFLSVLLTNYAGQTITLGIDVYNVYLVGYLTGTNSYIFQDAPPAPFVLFPGSVRTILGYTGSYTDLERFAGPRSNIPLGLAALDASITNLFRYTTTSLPRSFLVVIQMISEAARYRYIELAVSSNLNNGKTPDPAFLSLENNWGALSTQIQLAQGNNGTFPHNVTVSSVSGNPVVVTNVSDKVVTAVALLLYNNVAGTGSINLEKEMIMNYYVM